MKSFTSLEQSRRLAEILPLESADMYYCYGMDIHTKKWDYDIVPTIIDASNQIDIDDIPCWSLATLFEVIPKYIEDHYVLRMDYNKDFSIWYDDIGYGVDIELPVITKDSAIDACYEMIIHLRELNLL